RQDPDQRILWHLGWQEAANGAPARNGGMNRRHVFYGHFDPLFKRKRKPGRDQWPENNDGENEELDPEERDNGTVYHPQPDPFRDNALHNKKQQPKWRRQQADLQRDQHDNEERQEIYIAGRGKRQKEGKRQQHHADLIHERAEEQQHRHDQEQGAEGAELPRSDDAQKPSRRAGNLQDLAEGCRARNDKEDHRRHLRRLAKRLHQRLEIELAIAKTGDYCGNTAKRRRFLGRCNLEDNAADDNTEDQQQRHHIREKSAPRASPVDLRLIIGTDRGKRWIEPAADNDIECEERRHQKAGHDTGEQQILDRAFGKACEQDGERRRRYQHGDSAHGHDRAHGERRAVAPLQLLGQHHFAHDRRVGDGRAGERGKDRAGRHRDDGEAPGKPPDQRINRPDGAVGDTGLEHNLAHQDKQGHGDETEFGDGEDELHRHAGEANLAAEKKENADDVDG